MIFHLGWWLLPLIASLPGWLWVFLTPAPPPSTGYFYIPDLMPLVRGTAALVLTLIAWLLYFIVIGV